MSRGQLELIARTRHNDFWGDAAADHHDIKPISRILEERSLIRDSEHVGGVRCMVGEVDDEVPPASVTVYLVSGSAGSAEEVREVRLEMEVVEFFRLFKQFAIVLEPFAA